MTFTEAAVEVLRLIGRPLHYKKITEIAIERNLLSHVGKSPEITMSSRLATMVKKDRGEAPLVKVKPGIFGLREFSKEVLAMGELEEGDVEDILEAIDEEAAEAEEAEVKAAAAKSAEKNGHGNGGEHAAATNGDVATSGEGEAVEAKASIPPKPAHKLPGQEVYPEEEDDDLPILSKVDEPADAEGDDARGRKRRRKKRRGGEGEERPAREERTGREERGDRGSREARDNRGGRDQRREERSRDRDRDRDQRRDERAPRREPEVRGDWQREPGEGDLAGKDLSDAIESALASRGGRGQPFVEIADALVSRGRLSGDANALAPTIAAAVRGDIARRSASRERPRFRLRFGEVSLVDAAASNEVTRAEQDAVRALSRHREMVHRSLIRRLQELPNASLLEVIATWLNAVGVTSLRGVRRTGSAPGEFHLAGVLRRGPEELPIAILLVRDGLVGRERVVDMRGSLHRYGDARQAWVLALGGLHGGAREEAAELAAAPVALFDGLQLARSMEDVGVGVRRFSLPLVMLDFDLFDELRGPGAPPKPAREPQRHERPERAERPVREEERDEDDGSDADEGDEPEDTAAEKSPAGEGADAAQAGEGGGRRRRRRRRRRRGAEAATGAEAEASESAVDEGDEGDDAAVDAADDRAENADADLDEDREDEHDRGEDRDDDLDREDDDLDRDDDRDDDRDAEDDDLDRDDDRDPEDDDDDDDDLDEREPDVDDSSELDIDDLDDDR